MQIPMSRILRFWVECEFDEVKTQGPGRAKSELLAQILRKFEAAGDAMRFLNADGRIAWKATPRMLARLADGTVTEIILATDPNLEGEATATYLARMIKPIGLRVTRPASGLPVGGELEYADEVTLGRAFEGRRLLDV